MVKKIKRLVKRPKVDSPEYIEQAAENAPRITNRTVAEHREQVLSRARKYVLPLQHSKHQIVIITTTLFLVSVIAFFSYCVVALYRLQSNTVFLYRVTQVIPFPVARVGNNFVAYENYLFELRRYVHYYENQQATDFTDPNSKPQLDAYRQQALDKVVNDAYVKQLAARHGVTITDQELDEKIAVVRSQNRLGGSDEVFEDVLRDYYGWTTTDFRRSLKAEMLAEKVAAKLDTTAMPRAQEALAKLQSGADFAAVAAEYSEDGNTKDNGGEYGYPLERSNRNLDAQTTQVLFSMEPGQHSEIIGVGDGLEIVKNIERSGERIRAAHIFFRYEPISTYIDDLKDETAAQTYI
ncbi:hypothetical protein CR970_02070 [Candidatus Saccharibacteria bacterium]|nr:MAG: hypothetical protein CR970_02070 [Candidatus Saccharibacteria bacterium]